MRDLKVEVIVTGNELLDGSIVDTNSQRLAQALVPLGHRISRITVVPDDPETIRQIFTQALFRANVIIFSGGLGPTTDDLTIQVAAETMGVNLVWSDAARANIDKRLLKFPGRKFNEGHRKQCFVPEGAEVLSNFAGTAPGISWNIGGKQIFFLAGVPKEFDFVLHTHIVKWFKHQKASAQGEFLIIYKVIGWPESELNLMLKKFKLPAGVELGFRTMIPENHIKFLVKARSEKQARARLKPITEKLRKKLGSDLFTEIGENFEQVILGRLIKKKARVALAESCTGGLASSILTRVSGSSKVLDRSFLTYSDESKIELLGVREATLKKFGAVSEEVAQEMLQGALKRSSANRGVAITGIAGPTGGSREKPVGTVWIAVGDRKKTKTLKLHLGFDRELNQKVSAFTALDLLAAF